MQRIKNTHRPSAPKAARLPACGQGDKEANTKRKALVCMAVGAGKSHDSSRYEYGGGVASQLKLQVPQQAIERQPHEIERPSDNSAKHRYAGLANQRRWTGKCKRWAGEHQLHSGRPSVWRLSPRCNALGNRAGDIPTSDVLEPGCSKAINPAALQSSHTHRDCLSDSGLMRTVLTCWHGDSDMGYLYYGINSCLRRMDGGLSQFGPVFMPVVGAHFLAGDSATRKALNGFAVLGGYALIATHHL
jgi:hypothetical protein